MVKDAFMLTKAGLIVILALISSVVVGDPLFNNYKPYFGVFARMNHFSWMEGFGNNLFRKDVPQAELYLGTQLGDYVSVDIGYQVSATKRKVVNLAKDDVFLGLPIEDPDAPVSFLSFVQSKGAYTNLNAILPLRKIFPLIGQPNIAIVGQMSLVYLQIAHRVHTIGDLADNFNILSFTKFFKNQRIIPCLGVGLQYQSCGQTCGG
jgi:hypothetical protein